MTGSADMPEPADACVLRVELRRAQDHRIPVTGPVCFSKLASAL